MHRTQFKFTCRPLGVGEGEGGEGGGVIPGPFPAFSGLFGYIRRDEATRGTGTDIETLDDWNGDLRDWATRGSNK